MAVPRIDRQDKILYFRNSNYTAGLTQEVFYPLKQLRGITTQLIAGSPDYSYLEFWFDPVRNISLDDTSVSDGADRIKIRFNNRSVMYGAILYLWQDLYTSKDVVYKIIDAVNDGNNTIEYAAFGRTYNKYVWGHSTNDSYDPSTDSIGDGSTAGSAVIFYLQDD